LPRGASSAVKALAIVRLSISHLLERARIGAAGNIGHKKTRISGFGLLFLESG
jgi:hypothetical protein